MIPKNIIIEYSVDGTGIDTNGLARFQCFCMNCILSFDRIFDTDVKYVFNEDFSCDIYTDSKKSMCIHVGCEFIDK